MIFFKSYKPKSKVEYSQFTYIKTMITRILVSFIICYLSSFVSAVETDNSYHADRYRRDKFGKSGTDYVGSAHNMGFGGGKYVLEKENPYLVGVDGELLGMDAGRGADAGYKGGQDGYGRRGFGYRGRQGRYGRFGGGGDGVGRGYGGGEGGYYREAPDETEGVGSPKAKQYDSPPGPPQGAQVLDNEDVRERRPFVGFRDNGGGANAVAQGYGGYRGARRRYDGGEGGYCRGAQDETEGMGTLMRKLHDSARGPPQDAQVLYNENVQGRRPFVGFRDNGGGANAVAQGYGGYRGARRRYDGGEDGYCRGAQDETERMGSLMRRPYDSARGPPQDAQVLDNENVQGRRPFVGFRDNGGGANAVAQGYGGYRGARRRYDGGEGGYCRGAQDETEGTGSLMRRPYDSARGPPRDAEVLDNENVQGRRPFVGFRDYGGGANGNSYMRRPTNPPYDTAGRYGGKPKSIRRRLVLRGDLEFMPNDAPIFNINGERILGIYYSLPEVMETIKGSTDNTTWYVTELFTYFQNARKRCENKIIGPLSEVQSRKRNIIINIEGTNREVNKKISIMVARRLGAEICLPPSSTLSRYGMYFTSLDIEKRRAYFGLNFYAMADEVKGVISSVPVILTSYWMDFCVCGVIKYYDEHPEGNSSAYAWPKDLVKPDVLFFLNLPEYDDVQTDLFFYKIKQVTVYRRLQDPKPIEINSTTDPEEVVSIILKHVNNLLEGGQAPTNTTL